MCACRATGGSEPGDVSRALEARLGPGLVAGTEPLPPGVDLADGLDDGEAVAIALWRNPDLAAALAELGVARARLAEAGLLRDPVLSFLFPLGPKQYEWTLSLPLDFLWQRPRRIEGARADLEHTATELVRHGLDLARDVRLAFLDAVAAAERAQVAARLVELEHERLRLVDARSAAGDSEPADLSRARLRVLAAESASTRLACERTLSVLRLEHLLGVELGPAAPDALADSGTPPASGGAVERLLAAATAARPEVRAAEVAVEEAAAEVGLAQAEAWKLSLLLDANEKGSEGFEMGPGLAFSIPLASLAGGAGSVARANLEGALQRRAAVGARVGTEVRSALVRYEGSCGLLRLQRERAEQDVTRLAELTRRARDLGDAAPEEWIAAELEELQARRESLELDLLRRRAWIELERAVGCRLERLAAISREGET